MSARSRGPRELRFEARHEAGQSLPAGLWFGRLRVASRASCWATELGGSVRAGAAATGGCFDPWAVVCQQQGRKFESYLGSQLPSPNRSQTARSHLRSPASAASRLVCSLAPSPYLSLNGVRTRAGLTRASGARQRELAGSTDFRARRARWCPLRQPGPLTNGRFLAKLTGKRSLRSGRPKERTVSQPCRGRLADIG
jgi:hypothetical protein